MIRTRVDSLLETKRKNMQDIRYKKSRREFLSTSAKSIVLASIALQGGFVFAKESNKSISSIQHKPMPKRILGSGKAAMQVSALAFGCMGLNYHRSKKLSKKEAQNILAQALDYGITLFDTAQVYGNGSNEILVGELLKPYKDKIFITTKFGFGKDADSLDSSPKRIREVVENSLKVLNLEQIPLLYQHRADPKTPIEEVAGVVADLIQEGKVARFGVCELNAQSITKAHRICPLTAVQSEYHLMWRNVESEIFPTLENLGIGFVAYSPLNRGYLSGTLTKDSKFDVSNDNRATFPRFQPKALEANYKIVEVLREFGASKNASSAQVALAYLLAKKPYIIPLFGTTDSKHLREDIGALDVSFSASEWQNLEAKLDKIEIVGDRYPKEQAQRVGR